MQTPNYLSTKDVNVDIGDILSQGWEIFKQNISGFVGFCILSSILISISALTAIGIFIVSMPLMAGFYVVSDKIYRQEDYSFGNFFSGFRHTISLFFLFLVQAGIWWLTFYAISFFYTPAELGTNLQESDKGFFLPFIFIAEIIANLFSILTYLLLAMIPLTYLFCILSLAPLLVVFQDVSFLKAIKMSISSIHSHLLKVLIVYILIVILGVSGVIAFSFGIIFTIPLSYCMHYALYRQLFPS